MWLLAAASAAGRGAVVLVGTTAEPLLAAALLPPALSARSPDTVDDSGGSVEASRRFQTSDKKSDKSGE